MEKNPHNTNDRIDLLKKEELKQWCDKLSCKEEDLIHAVHSVGNSAKIVDMYLELNRKKIDHDQQDKG